MCFTPLEGYSGNASLRISRSKNLGGLKLYLEQVSEFAQLGCRGWLKEHFVFEDSVF